MYFPMLKLIRMKDKNKMIRLLKVNLLKMYLLKMNFLKARLQGIRSLN